MANKFTTGNSFSTGDQVTAAKLNASINSATFDTGAVDDATTEVSSGAIIVKDAGITNAKLATNAVTTAKITDSNVTTAKITDSNVTTAKIADNNVTTAKIADTNVTTAKLATNAVTTDKITDSNVTKAKIENVANMRALGNVSGSAAAPAEVAILDEDNMASNSATSLATQQSIKAYADSKVDGTGAGSFTTLAASGDLTVDTTTLKVDSTNNRVGIGTASPSYLLDVSPTSDGGEIARFKSDTTNAAADVLIVDQDNLLDRAALQVQGNAGSTECLFVGSNGNVGIGTTSPSQPLDVNGQARVVGNLFVGTDDTTPNGMIEVYGAGDAEKEGGEIRLRAAAAYDGTYNHYFIDAYEDDFRIGREGGADITLTSDGNVGIGTASPSSPLTVSGDVEINVSGASNSSKAIVINSSGTNFEPDAGIIQGTHAGSGSLTGGYWLKFNANSDDKFTVKGNGDTDISGELAVKGGGSGSIVVNDEDSSLCPTMTFLRNGGGTTTNDFIKFENSGGEVAAINASGGGYFSGNVGIGEASPSAPLIVTSTTGGVIMPRMTTTQMNAISSPANGEMIYNTTDNKFYGYANGAWVALH